jgi:HTH-type transcriptional regulator/antitoxin HigA
VSDPIDAIETMLAERNWTSRHLMAALGTTGKISEIMNRKRPLSIGMIRCLVFNYGMNAETMIKWYPTKQQPDEPVNVFVEVFKVRKPDAPASNLNTGESDG